MPLVESFLAELGAEQRAACEAHPRDALEAELARLFATGRAELPEVVLAPERFAAWLGRVTRGALASAADATAALAQLHAADLYLACACAEGDPVALARFEAEELPTARAALADQRIAPALRDELVQELRAALFTPRGELAPMIANYSGRGRLRGWLRVAAVRMGQRALGKERRQVPLPEAALDGLAAAADPELARLKLAYRAEFREAVRGALASLEARARTLLCQHYLDELGIDELGALYRVHRATAARWIAAAREELLERTRAALQERLSISSPELDSVLRLIASRLDVTLRDILKPPE
jgi:RNA polymerase sigma-70 factor (ECF subfamily)